MRKPVLGVLLIAASCLALSGCGSSSSSAGDSDHEGSTKITVLRSTGATFEPLIIAEDQGYFKDEGLEVTIKAGAPDTAANVPVVVRGDAQFAMADTAAMIKAAATKVPVKMVVLTQASTAKTAPSDGVLVPADSPIKSMTDLGGKTIGVSGLGGTTQFITQYNAQKAGVDPKTIKFVALPIPSLNDAAMQGKVDGVSTFASFLDAGKAQGMRAISNGTNELPGLPQGLVFSSADYVAKNPDTVKKFIAAVEKGIDYANAHPDAVRDIDLKLTQAPPDYIKNRQPQIFSSAINPAVLQTMAEGMKEFGITDTVPDMKSMLASQAPTTDTSE